MHDHIRRRRQVAAPAEVTWSIDNYRIPARSGSVTIRYAVARELESAELARPVRIWLYVMERTSAHTTRVIGKAGPFEYQ